MTGKTSNNASSGLPQSLQNTSGVYREDVHNLVGLVLDKISEIYSNQGPAEGYSDPDTEELYQVLGKEYLRKLVLESYKTLKPFTFGMEGEVFKIDLGFKQMLLLKRRLSPGISQEFNLHKIAYELSKSSKSGVKVPIPYDSFNDGNYNLILMEFIKGKTLYNLVWQSILQDKLFIDIEKALERNKDGVLLNNFKHYKQKYTKNGKVDFENDSICEEGVIELLQIMHQALIIRDNPGTVTYSEGKKEYLVLAKIYKDNFSKANIFESEKQKGECISHLKQFLNDLHDEGFFHRDLGGNPRNIMFNDGLKPTVIDFGKSVKLDSSPNKEELDGYLLGTYDNDNNIIDLLKTLPIKKEVKESVEIGTTEDIISRARGVGLEIQEEFIIANYDFLNKRSKSLKSTLEHLIIGTYKDYGNHIFTKQSETDKFKIESTLKGKKELFLMIYSLSHEEKQDLKNHLQSYLSNSKISNKYKYAKLFDDYLAKV